MPSGPAVGEIAEEPEAGGARGPVARLVDEALLAQGGQEFVEVAVDVADDEQRAAARPAPRGATGSTVGSRRVSPRLITGRSRAVGV